MLNIALPKGRLGEKVYGMFEKAGFECPSIRENNRKLIFENEAAGVRYFWVKPSDVAIYVERGAADIGVAGKDILLEYAPDVYELLDLDTGKCRMAVAAKADFRDMKDDYAILPYPKFNEAQTDYYTHMNSFFPYAISIPVTNTRLEETGAVMEALGYISQTTILPKINEAVLNEKIARDEDSKEMLDILFEK